MHSSIFRIDRSTLPELPRPIYEVQATYVDRDLRVSLMAGSNELIHYTEFASDNALGERLAQWLGDRPYKAVDRDAWNRAIPAIVSRIVNWRRATAA